MDVATVVWVAPDGPASEASATPDGPQSRALSAWGRAHGVRLVEPAVVAIPAIAVDPAVGERVEDDIDRARDAVAAHDADRAERAIEAADATLRAHAELPQAAWLMAEVERARAALWRRVAPLDAGAADLAWARAEALDGGRVAGVGEEAAPAHAPNAAVTLAVSPGDARAWLDGEPIGVSEAVATRAGLHALVVTWAGVPVWASWVEVSAGGSTLDVPVDVAPACSAADVSRARVGASGAVEARFVRCRSWVAVEAGARPATVRVATCETDRCGDPVEWRAPAPWTWAPPVREDDERRSWPAWATWALVGGGAAVAAGVIAVAAGAFQQAPTETRFASGGLKSP
ncbi:MAG TPA: hypothetical protein VGM06_21795 [Polyangiaceae bacterium]|jgi:hypothetical protein